jgi:hypothetical protein
VTVSPVPWASLLGAAASLVFLGGLLTLWGRRVLLRGRLRRRALIAREGEARAETILADQGWAVDGRQVTATYDLLVSGTPLTIGLRADYLVTRGGRRYVAEVKTGRFAPQLDTPATRRQLLEYRVAFGVDGVLLVDAETERVLSIEFPPLQARLSRRPGFAWALLLGLLAFGLGTWLALEKARG